MILVLGALGAYVGHRLPVPAGALIGAVVGVGGAGLVSGELLELPQPPIPGFVNNALQILLGMLVGFRMTRCELRSGAHALVPATLLTLILIGTSVAIAVVADRLTDINVITALFAAAPGGLTEMSVISLSFEADGATVAAIQLVRVLLALAIVDVVLKRFEKNGSEGEPEGDPEGEQEEEERDASTETAEAGEPGLGEELKLLGVALPWGILGGVVGVLSGVPAGGIIGSLAGSAAFMLLTDRPVPLRKYQVGVQTLGGGIIGLNVSADFFAELADHAWAGVLIIATQMVLWLLMALLLAKFFRYDPPTSTLASTPGGISGIIPAAGEANANVVVVTFIHLVRLSTIVVVVPLIVGLFFEE